MIAWINTYILVANVLIKDFMDLFIYFVRK